MHGQVTHPTERVEASGRTFRPVLGIGGGIEESILPPVYL